MDFFLAQGEKCRPTRWMLISCGYVVNSVTDCHGIAVICGLILTFRGICHTK